MLGTEVYGLIKELNKVFDEARIVDPKAKKVMTVTEDGSLRPGPDSCHNIWHRNVNCEDCVSSRACNRNIRLEKIECVENDMFHVTCSPVELEGGRYVLETIGKVHNDAVRDAASDETFASFIRTLQDHLYKDALTGVMNRRFFEENTKSINSSSAIAVIDMDDFKHINDVYGHVVGDLALKAAAEEIKKHTRESDILVRFGGDEFLLAYDQIPRDTFLEKMESIRTAITQIVIPKAPGLKLSVSIGCSYSETGAPLSFESADIQLYVAKLQKNAVAIDNSFVSGQKGDISIRAYSLNSQGDESRISLSHYKELDIIKKQNAVIAGLSGSLDFACYVNTRAEEVICFQMSDSFKRDVSKIEGDLSFYDKIYKFLDELVHPDDLPRFRRATKRSRVMAELNEDKIYIHDFKAIIDGKIQYYRIQFTRDTSDKDGIIFGLINIDEEKREERRRTEEETLRRMMITVGGLDDEAAVVYVINPKTGRYNALLNDERFGSKLDPLRLKRRTTFEEDSKGIIDEVIYEPDREAMREFIKLDRLVEEIDQKGAAQIEYRMTQGSTPYWCQLRVIYASNDEFKALLARVCVVDNLHRAEAETLSLDAFLEKYTSVYKVDLDNNKIYPFKISQRVEILLDRMKNRDGRFQESAERFIRHFAVLEDCAKLLQANSPEYIRSRLANERSFSETARLISPEGYRYYEVSVTRLGDEEYISECLLGFTDSHELVMRKYASQILFEDYYSAYIVNLHTGTYTNVHRNKAYGTTWGMTGNYDEVMATEKPYIHPDDWYILEEIDTVAKLKKYIEDGRPEELTYRTSQEEDPWEICIIKVLDTWEGKPSNVLIAYAPPQRARAEGLDYQRTHKETDRILSQCIRLINSGISADSSIKGLLSILARYYGATLAHVCDIDEEKELVRSTIEWHNPKFIQPSEEKRKIIFRREIIAKMKKEGILHLMPREEGQNEILAVPFYDKHKISGFLALVDPTAVKDDVAVLRHIGTFIQGEQLRKKREEIEHAEKTAVISVLSDDFDGVSYVTLRNDKHEDIAVSYRETKEIAEVVPTWRTERIFPKMMADLCEYAVHPDDKEHFKAEVQREKILKALETKTSYITNFRAVVKSGVNRYQLKFVADRDENGQLKGLVAGLHNTEQEINQERERQIKLEEIVQKRTQEIREKNEALNKINEEIIDLFGALTEARDLESGEHINRVKGFTYILASQVMKDHPEYDLNDYKVDLISSASALHDVGKIMISDSILMKPGKLTPEEFEEMKTHCIKGVQILKKAPSDWSGEYTKVGLEICRWHHEKYDGKGYPDGLVGDQIPISAQIVSVADCFDALISKRVYKDAYGYEESAAMIKRGECGVFSPKILSSFDKCIDKFYAYARERSSKE